MSVCPACEGRGRLPDPVTTGGLLCLACDGTGNAQAARLLRAYRLGYEHGIRAMRNGMPNGYGTEDPMTLDRLAEIVARGDS